MQTVRDFDWLSERIVARLHERLSPTTLKRFWGYLSEPVTPSRWTLDLLARFVGYTDYNMFCQQPEDGVQSDFILSRRLIAGQLAAGCRIQLTWLPDRSCTIEYCNGGKFKVVGASNTKLCVGDTFECHLFIQHEPLFLDNLVHCGQEPVAYVAGKKNGVTFEVVNVKTTLR